MQRKPAYWVCIALIVLYILIFFIIIFLYFAGINRGAMAAYAFIWGIFSVIVFIPITLLIMRARCLPEQCTTALLYQKFINVTSEGTSDSGYFQVPHYFFAFIFTNGTTRTFEVPKTIFDTLNENDSGILTFKGKGRTWFFIRFEVNNC